MANEFIIRKGYKSLASSEVTGSLNVSGNIVGAASGYLQRLYIQDKKALDSSSNFLYIDPNTEFTSGVYINNAVRIDGGLLGSYNEDLQLRTGTTTRITIANADGAVRFHNYGAGYLKTDSSGNITVDTSTIEDTLDSVTGRGATTTNNISVGKLTGTSAEFTETDNTDPGADDLNVSGYGIIGNRTTNPIYVHNFGNGGIRLGTNTTLGDSSNGVLITDTLSTFNGDVNVTGTLTAQEFHTEFVSASIIYESGSTKFGDTSDDVHSFTGSLEVSGSGVFNTHIGAPTTPYTNDDQFLKFVSPDGSTGTLVNADNGNTWLNAAGGKDLWLNWYSLASPSSKADLQVGDGNGGAAILSVDATNRRVGINNTSPLRNFHVVGNFAVNAGTGEFYGVNITGGESSDPTILIGDWHNSSANISWDSTGNYLRIDAQHSTSGAPIVFSGNDASTEYMRLTSTGRVGIGTTNPTKKLDVNGDARFRGTIEGDEATTLIKDVITDQTYEGTAFYNPETINAFAGADKWATITLTNAKASDRTTEVTDLGAHPFTVGGNTSQIYFDTSETEIVIEIDHTAEPLRHHGIVGIQFTNTGWRAERVKIEGYNGSSWTTGLDTTTNTHGTVVAKLALGSNGVQKTKITLGNPANSSGGYMRISKIFGYDYKGVSSRDAVKSGTYYLEKFVDNGHYSNIYPAVDSTYNLGTSGLRYANIYADTLHGSVTNATTASYVAGGNVDGAVASATTAGSATTASYVAGGNVDGAVASATTATTASNAMLLDGIDSTSFLRSDADDTMSGNLSLQGNLLLTGTATTTNQGRMIDFTGFDKEGTTDFSDRAYIQHTTNTGGHAGSVLVISSQNDSGDGIAFLTNASSQLKHNSNTIWTSGNDGPTSGLAAQTAATASYVDYSNLAGTIPTWNQNTTGTAATASYIAGGNVDGAVASATTAGSATTASYVAGGNVDGAVASATTATTASYVSNADTVDGIEGSEIWRKGTDIPNAADLDNYTTDGYYHQNSNNNATNGTNYPANLAGMLSVQSDGVMVYQTYQVYNTTTDTYRRGYYNGTWYAWKRILMSNDTITATTASNAMLLDGIDSTSFLRSDADDTFSGNITGNAIFTTKTGTTPNISSATLNPNGIITSQATVFDLMEMDASNKRFRVFTGSTGAGTLNFPDVGTDNYAWTLPLESGTIALTSQLGTAETASYVAGGNVDGAVASATTATTASYALTGPFLTSYTESDTLDSVTGRGSTTTNSITVGNIIAGTTSLAADSVVRVLAGDGNRTGFEAYGNSQGTGYLFVGQSSAYGGGVSYNGDNSPAFVSGETADRITFYRMTAGNRSEVFSYAHNDDTVAFNGDISIGGGDITLGGTGRIQGIDTVSSGTDAANKTYVDNKVTGLTEYVAVAGDTMTGTLNINRTGTSQIAINSRAYFGTHYTDTDVWIYGTTGDTILLGGGIGSIQNDVNVGNGDLIVPNGDVGIGTTAPATQLNINSGAGGASGTAALRIGGTSNYASLELGITGNYGGMIRSYGNDIHYYSGHWRTVGNTASENHSHYWYTSRSGSADWSSIKMELDHNGNLGIGTTSPSSKLEVYSSGSTVLDIQGSQGQLFSITDDLTGDLLSISDISGIPIFNVNASGDSYFDGNLDISGSLKVTGSAFFNGLIGNSPVENPGVHIGLSAGNDGSIQIVGTSAHIDFANAGSEDYDMRIKLQSNDELGIFGGNLDLNANNIVGITDMYVGDQIIHDGDTNTYMQFHAADQWRVVTGGGERLEVNSTNTTVANTLITTGGMRLRSSAADQTSSGDTTSIPSTTAAEIMKFEGTSYTNGQYTTELVKLDRGGNLPLYFRQSKSTANSFSNLIRIGDHANNSEIFHVFGSTKIDSNLTVGGNIMVANSGNVIGNFEEVLYLYAGGTSGAGFEINEPSNEITLKSIDGIYPESDNASSIGSSGKTFASGHFTNFTVDSTLTVGTTGADGHLRVQKADDNVSDHIQFYVGSTRIGEIGGEDTSWLRINQETAKNIYTPRYIRADGGLFVDSTAYGIDGNGRLTNASLSGTYSNSLTFSGGFTNTGYVQSNFRQYQSTNWRKNYFVRSVGVTGSDIGDKWVHLMTVPNTSAYAKFKAKFKIDGYDDVSSGEERIDVIYENNDTTQENHQCFWGGGDGMSSLFKEVKSIRSSSSGLNNTYQVWVKMEGDWRDTFTVEVEWFSSAGTPPTFPTSIGTTTNPTGNNDISKTYRALHFSSALEFGPPTDTSDRGIIHYGSSGKLGAASTFDPNGGQNGFWIEGTQDNESGGVFMNGNTFALWSPGDANVLNVYDEDQFSAGAKFTISGNGTVQAAGDVIAFYSSDSRLKDNIIPINNAIDKINKIGGYEFDWNDNQKIYEGHDVGVIAQEVEKVLPEVVQDRDDGYKAVKYEKLVPLLIEGIKEQQNQIDELKAIVEKLQNDK